MSFFQHHHHHRVSTLLGTDAIITMDLHDPQFQGFFDIPVDNLRASPLMVKYIREMIPDYQQALIVSPDAGGAKKYVTIITNITLFIAMVRASTIANQL